jgi:hypothetical protein
MKTATYALAGAICAERGLAAEYGPPDKDGNKPLIREAVKITTPEAENVGEFLTLMEDGKEEHMLRLAQGQLDIIRQRKIREAAEDAVTAAILDGKTEVELDVAIDGVGAEGDKITTADYSETDRREIVRARCQAIGDAYVYGSRGPSTGGGKVTKEKAAKQTKLEAAVAAGELTEAEIEKLKSIGAL